jgi:putative membrane protein
MRVLCLLFLLVFLGAVGLFAYENQQFVSLRFLNWSDSLNLPLVIGAAYVLGMLSGWTVVGILRRSVSRVVEPRDYASSR